MRHLLNWREAGPESWDSVLERSLYFAGNPAWTKPADGKSIGLLFFNPSVRTRTSMELAAVQLGAHPTVLNVGQGTWGFAFDDAVMDGGQAEHIEEAIGVLSQYYDAIGVRIFAQQSDLLEDVEDRRLNQIAKVSQVPVMNLESAFFHPCQAMADATTLAQVFHGAPEKRKFVLAWSYHPKALPMAVPNSALLAAARLGMDVTVCAPDAFSLHDSIVSEATHQAALAGGSVSQTSDYKDAFDGAEVIYAKSWGGLGVYENPAEEEMIRSELAETRITMDRMSRTNDAFFMHCLPVRRGVVVDTDVLKRRRSIHLQQAGNRLPAQKAMLEYLWNLS